MTIYTIPFGEPLLDHMATGLLQETASNPFQLSKYVVLLPTKRGCLNLQQAFFKQACQKTIILPKIIALSDLETIPLLPGFSLPEMIPEAITSWQRLSLLTQLIYRYYRHQAHPIDYATAFNQAQDLAGLLDEMETSAIDLEKLNDLVGENFASHWQITLDFLKIITEFWPQILKDQDKLDPSYRKRLILEKIADHWRPTYPVILAGTTGTRPATARLAKAILSMDQGRLILPGFDKDAPWPIPPTHPQYTMGSFIQYLGANPNDVALWPTIHTPSPKVAFLQTVMTPTIPEDWALPIPLAPELASIEMVPCSSGEEEVHAIALMCRYHLEEPHKTIAVITPDRSLSERLRCELQRWGVMPDLSSGIPLSQTVVGQFLRLCSLIHPTMSVVDWLALMKHPLALKAQDRGYHLMNLRRMEKFYLRGKRLTSYLWDIPLEEDDLKIWLDELRTLTTPLLEAGKQQPLSQWLAQHMATAQGLIGNEALLWQDDDGTTAQDFITHLLHQEEDLPALTHQEYSRIFTQLMGQQAVRFAQGIGSRVRILGALEARQNQTDVTILAGLNEGVWPKGEQTDPWLNRPMRLALGLPDPQRQIGLSAHDFCLGFNSQKVYLTRSLKAQGRATMASRWWQRLEALMGAPASLKPTPWQSWARNLSAFSGPTPCGQPAPLPPQEARPKVYSATDIDHLMRDPYGFYARKVLKIKAMEWLEPELSMRDWGIRVHGALDAFARLPAPTFERLLQLGESAFQDLLSDPTVATFWWPRFSQMATWFFDQWAGLAPLRRHVFSEYRGRIDLNDFEIKSIADRIDHFADGSITIVDYKTGEPPSEKLVLLGLAPQLLIEAFILHQGGFPDIPSPQGFNAEFWHLKGGNEGGKIKGIKITPDHIHQTEEGLSRLLHHYCKNTTAYVSYPWGDWLNGVLDYQHLARLKEWRMAKGEK